jgi:hypothetical protein
MNHYALESDLGTPEKPKWSRLAVWRCEPENFRSLLSRIEQIHHLDRGGWEYIRVRRIPEVYGEANWEFDGANHREVKH